MAGRGMGAATRGGGAVTSGAKNKKVSSTESTTGIPMYKKGGAVNKMTKGGSVKKMMGGGMMKKGYAKGGAINKKMK